MRLVQTCGACPEQYDVFHGKRKVGYLRLRHGHFRAHFLGVGGEVVYEAETIGDGIFDASEREHHLTMAKTALRLKLDQYDEERS